MTTNAIADLEVTDLSGNKMLVNAFDIALVHSTTVEAKRTGAGFIAFLLDRDTEQRQVTELVLKDVHVAAAISGAGGGQFVSHSVEGYKVQVQESVSDVAAKKQTAMAAYLSLTK